MDLNINFYCSSLPLEEQCNQQGFTLGSKKDEFQCNAQAIQNLYQTGLLTDKEKESACRKLFNRINRAVRLLHNHR